MTNVFGLTLARIAENDQGQVREYKTECNLDGFYTSEEPAPYGGPGNAVRADR
jgi:hypothetical protein